MPSSRYRRVPAGGGISIVVAARAISAVMRRAAARGAVPCRISPAVSFLRLVEYRFSSHRTVMSFRRPACRFGISCRIRLHCMASCRSGEFGDMVYRIRFVSVSSHLVSSPRLVSSRHVSSFCPVSSIRLVSTRLAIRFARYGKREEGVIRLFICAAVFKHSVWFFNPASIWWNTLSCLVFPYIVRLNIM